MKLEHFTYAAFFSELQKIAEDEHGPSRAGTVAGHIGSGLAGFGLGTGTGLLLGHGINEAYKRVTGRPGVPKSLIYGGAPLLGLGSGIAYSIYKAKEQEAIRRALANQTEPGAG